MKLGDLGPETNDICITHVAIGDAYFLQALMAWEFGSISFTYSLANRAPVLELQMFVLRSEGLHLYAF